MFMCLWVHVGVLMGACMGKYRREKRDEKTYKEARIIEVYIAGQVVQLSVTFMETWDLF